MGDGANRLIINLIDMKVCADTYKLIFILAILSSTSALPLPQCQTSPFYKTLPLVPNESYIMNLDSFFGGYNLEYTVLVDQSIRKYISLSSKLRKQKEEFPDIPMTGLKSSHLTKVGNSWGQQFITLSQKGSKTVVHYGILNDNTTVPVINNIITVVDDRANTTCYDAVLFPVQDRIIVDCA
jgi:hypothetical protein